MDENLMHRLNKGGFIQPTLFTDIEENAKINKEEVFGPVAIFHTFKDEEEVIKRANDTGGTYNLLKLHLTDLLS
jgi:acyl-CoA reductase-like NAD-dependent aldehyde dehydrogenase